MRSRRAGKGFTLIELAVVLSIFLLLVGLLLFSSTGAKQTVALKNAAMVLAADLKKQRQRSITIEDRCGIIIQGSGYTCFESTPANQTAPPVDFSRLMGVNMAITQPPAGSTMDFSPQVPPGGTWAALQCTTPGSIVIQCGSQSRTVTVSGTGDITGN